MGLAALTSTPTSPRSDACPPSSAPRMSRITSTRCVLPMPDSPTRIIARDSPSRSFCTLACIAACSTCRPSVVLATVSFDLAFLAPRGLRMSAAWWAKYGRKMATGSTLPLTLIGTSVSKRQAVSEPTDSDAAACVSKSMRTPLCAFFDEACISLAARLTLFPESVYSRREVEPASPQKTRPVVMPTAQSSVLAAAPSAA
mmetsp:Transcript_28712/g.67326  ORF Transcript_28712/g.67326 Transcript_28712/m.67326 type:complete len:200 (+) Transcript_28712:349-948(+)